MPLQRDLIDMHENQYDRRLTPLQAFIVTRDDAGLCGEDGEFGPECQGISEYDQDSMGVDEEDFEEEA